MVLAKRLRNTSPLTISTTRRNTRSDIAQPDTCCDIDSPTGGYDIPADTITFMGRRLVVNTAYWSAWRPCSYRFVRCFGHRYFVGLSCVTSPNTNCLGVQTIEPGSPAELAGLQQGDLVMSINGQAPVNEDVLSNQFDSSALSMEILRDGSDVPTVIDVTPTKVATGI